MKRRLFLGTIGLACLLLLGGKMAPLELGSPVSAQPTLPGAAPSLGADPLQALSDRFEAIAAKVTPSVVSVEAVKPAKPSAMGKSKAMEESGSGVIIRVDDRPGYFVITNNHVITGAKNDQITIHLADGRLFRPAQVWTDPESDIALLSLEGAVALPAATLGNSDNAKVGRWVLAIGSPFGLNQSVSHGIISARDRGQVSLGSTIRIKEFMQTDAAINPGSSGGPLVDLNGHVIGINTAIASHNGTSSGVAFSIPINLVRRVVNQMLTAGTVQRGYLGAQLVTAMEPGEALRLGLDRLQGALVEQVYPDTPAAAAGLQPRDVVMQMDSVVIKTENHLINLVSSLPPGQRVRLQVWRERRLINLDVVIGDWAKATNKVATGP